MNNLTWLEVKYRTVRALRKWLQDKEIVLGRRFLEEEERRP